MRDSRKIHFLLPWIILLFLAGPSWAYEVLDDLEDAFEAHVSNDFDEAIKLYTKIIELDTLNRKNLSVLYLLRGEAWAEQGDCNHAIEDFTEAIRLRPEYAHAYYFRGNCFEYKGDYTRAWRDIEKAIHIRPDKELYRETWTLLASLMGKEEEELMAAAPLTLARKPLKIPAKARSSWKSAIPEFLRSPWSHIKTIRQRRSRE